MEQELGNFKDRVSNTAWMNLRHLHEREKNELLFSPILILLSNMQIRRGLAQKDVSRGKRRNVQIRSLSSFQRVDM